MPFKNRSNKLTSIYQTCIIWHLLNWIKFGGVKFFVGFTPSSAAAFGIFYSRRDEISNKSKNFKYSAGKGQSNPDTLSMPAAN